MAELIQLIKIVNGQLSTVNALEWALKKSALFTNKIEWKTGLEKEGAIFNSSIIIRRVLPIATLSAVGGSSPYYTFSEVKTSF